MFSLLVFLSFLCENKSRNSYVVEKNDSRIYNFIYDLR